MEQFAFVFTIFFSLLGPVKLISAFAGATHGADDSFKRSVAVRAFLIASAVVVFLALAGGSLVSRYRISIDALRIGGGLVLLLAALNIIFPKVQPRTARADKATPIQVAISPIATPLIVSPAGIAAILIFMMLAPEYPGIEKVVGIVLAIIMALDFLVMYFNSRLVRVPGVMMVLQVLGSVLIFMQVALAINTILLALGHLGIISAPVEQAT